MSDNRFFAIFVVAMFSMISIAIVSWQLPTIIETLNENIVIKSPAILYHASEIRVVEIRGQWPRAKYLAINEWLDSANVHVVDIDYDRSSCYITYINPREEE